jgi:quercetin dioxygenase-like cupin family protein
LLIRREPGRKKVTPFNSDFIMSLVTTERPALIGFMHLEEIDIIGFHQAVVPQLLLIINGEGWVRGKEAMTFFVKSGDAVFWKKGEWHETTIEKGLTAFIIECEKLTPSLLLQDKK